MSNARARGFRYGLGSLPMLALLALVLTASEPPPAPEELVKQLSSQKFNERAKASQALEKLGEAALPALQAAAKDPDPEVARRAAELIAVIQKQGEMDLALKPTLVDLQHQNAELGAIVADLARQSGFKLKLGDGVEEKKRLTIQTGKVPFWQAFDAVCAAAELTLGPVETAKEQRPGEIRGVPRGNLQLPQRLPPGVQMQIGGMNLLDGGTPVVPPTLRLIPGKAPEVPVAYVGALAVRALPIKQAENENIREHTALLIEVRAEPRLAWKAPLELRADGFMDEQGQVIGVTSVELSNQKQPEAEADAPAKMAQASDLPFNQQLVVLLRLPEKPGRQIPDLKAVLAGSIQGPRLPLITLTELAEGKTKKNANGDELEIDMLKETDDGGLDLRVRLTAQADGAVGGNQQFVFQNNVQIQLGGNLNRGQFRRMAGMGGVSDIALYDQDGKPYSLSMSGMEMRTQAGETVKKMTLHCEPPRAGSKPTKLVYESSKPTRFELPFSLKAVPLP